MQFAKLGETGISVSRLGLGTVKFGRNQGVKYPSQFQLPTDKEILSLLSLAKDSGINLLDTAPAYGTSEERLGKLLKDRHDWIICGKVGEEFVDGESAYDFTPGAIQKSLERSLRRLKTDYLDILLIHSNGEDEKIIDSGIFLTLEKMKKSGLIRAYGMSTKTIAGGLRVIDHSDVAMITYNPIHVEEHPIIAYAEEKKKGILIKKALASGHLNQIPGSDPVATALQFILKEPAVSSIILGTINPDHLQHNLIAAFKT